MDKVSLLATPKVPDDAVLVIAGPRAPFLDPERQAIQEYLDRGARSSSCLTRCQDPGLGEVISSWGVQVGEDQVIDPGRAYVGDPRPILPLPQNGHRITATLPDLILPEARSVTIEARHRQRDRHRPPPHLLGPGLGGDELQRGGRPP